MPLHDWTQVEAGIFHDFHTAWIAEIRKVLNGGLLPEGYYALAAQHAGNYVADILTRDRYINLPLETTYLSAYAGMPSFWQDVLEGRIRD